MFASSQKSAQEPIVSRISATNPEDCGHSQWISHRWPSLSPPPYQVGRHGLTLLSFFSVKKDNAENPAKVSG